MRIKRQPGVLELLITFVDDYMPTAAGLSANTIRLYKASFRLLLTYFYNVKEISADKIRFQDLNRETIFSFGDWIETERNCSVATRNIRLAALSAFASYAQNRNTDAALSFVTAIQNTPTKKAAYTPRISFSRAEVSALLHAPDTNSVIGRRDVVLLSLMYASGARAQEICDLRVSDVLFEKDTSRVVLTGKGKKARRICIASSCAEMLRRYLIWRKIDQQLDRHVFSSRTHEQMTVSCIEAIFKKYLVLHPARNRTRSWAGWSTS